MKDRIIIILTLTIFLKGSILLACQCQKATYKFTSNLSHYSFVGLVEIIGHDTFNDHDFDQSFTILKVIKQYNGAKTVDTISLADGDGGSCYVGLPGWAIGSKFIIKGGFDLRSEYEANFDDITKGTSKANVEKVLVLSLCDENSLIIKGDSIEGNITKKLSYKKASLDSGKKIVKIGYTKKMEKFGYYIVQQKMSVARVEKIIKRRFYE